jgi:PAS domain S-box-containing protein
MKNKNSPDTQASAQPGVPASSHSSHGGAGGRRIEASAPSTQQSEARLKLALSSARMGVWEWDQHTGAVFLSPECYAILELKSFGGTLEDVWQLVHPDDLDRVLTAAGRALAERGEYTPEFRVMRPDGRVQWVSIIGHFVGGEKEESNGMVGTLQDITERKEAEEELRRTHAELHLLSNRLLEVQEAARRDLARDLQDGVSTALSTVAGNLQSVRGLTKPDEQRLAESTELLTHTLNQLRQIALDLRPSILTEFAPSSEGLSKLTSRQREILQLIAEGMSTKEIAFLLKRSAKTVEAHRAQIMDRLQIHDVAGLVRAAIRCGLVSADR